MNTVRPEAAGLLLAPVFQAHVEGHGLDWATTVFSTSAIHQGSTSRILGPFQLSIPLKQVLSWLKTASDPQLCCTYDDNAMTKLSPCATLRVPQALGGY